MTAGSETNCRLVAVLCDICDKPTTCTLSHVHRSLKYQCEIILRVLRILEELIIQINVC